MHTAQFKKNYVLIMQNERGSEWSEGDFGILTTTTADAVGRPRRLPFLAPRPGIALPV